MQPIADTSPSRFLPWPVVAARRPDLAPFAATVLSPSGVAYLATVSRMGRPRVTPISVSLTEGPLLVTVDPDASAAHDLRANPFFHLHAVSGAATEQVAVRGWAQIVLDAGETVFELLADAAHGTSPSVAAEWAAEEPVQDPEAGPRSSSS